MPQRNDLIDGWRGLSVIAVIVGHLVTYRFSFAFDRTPLHTLFEDRASVWTISNNLFFRIISPLGEIGVSIFFVISGFLITHLMLIEEAKNSKISMAAFYVRRFCRIAPAFYLYLLAIFILRQNGLVQVSDDAFVRSAAYVCNFSGFSCSWWLAHTWSLSVEEQFYLIWPLLMTCFVGARTVIIGIALATSLIGSIFFPPLHGFAYIATGAIVASSPSVRAAIIAIARPKVIQFLALFILLCPILRNFQASLLMQLISPLMIALIFFGTLEIQTGLVKAVISNPALRKVGLISYSLYLWQQLGTAPIIWNGSLTGADQSVLWPTLFLIPAVISYFLLERPMIRVGQALSARILSRRIVAEKLP